MTDIGGALARAALEKKFADNADERRELDARTDANRLVLVDLVARGRSVLEVTRMAELAGLDRSTIHAIMRGETRRPRPGRPRREEP